MVINNLNPNEGTPFLQDSPINIYSGNSSSKISVDRKQSSCTQPCLKFTNVILMGIGFMLLFTAYNTTQNFVTSLLQRLGFKNLGFYSLSVLYGVVSISVFFAPVLVPKAGERVSMWIGAVCYCVYIASLVKIIVPLVYAASVVIGFGAAILWVAQGAFLTKCSDESTRGRNSGIFWGIFQLSGIIGNFSAYFILDSNETPSFLFLVLMVCGVCGVIVLLFLRPVKSEDEDILHPHVPSVGELMRKSIYMFGNKDMLLMLVFMFYSGIELSFYSGEFPLLMDAKKVGAVMGVLGAAEVFGGVVLGKLSDIIGRKVVVVGAILIYSGSLALCWLMKIQILPYNWVPYVAAIGLGLGDSTFNTQIYATLGTLFPGNESVGAFTVFQLLQNIGSAVGFFYAPFAPVHGPHGTYIQLIVVGAFGIVGGILFLLIDIRKKVLAKLDVVEWTETAPRD